MKQINIGIVPTIGHNFEAMFIEKNTFFSEDQGKNPMYLVKQNLEAKGFVLKDATKTEASAEFDLVLYFGNIDLTMLSKFRNSVNIYLAFEPPAVDLTNEADNLKRLGNYFDYIITWNDDLVDGEIFLKFNYTVDFFDYYNSTPFEERKLLTNISGRKQSRHKDELYSKRLEIINYFEPKNQDDFDFWGVGWDNERYKNYKGTAVSKIDVYRNYKFAICFENQKNLNGYITEKIWDCFISKIVPVYWGAENIEKYVPKGCYIDYRDQKDIEGLVSFLKSISKDEYYSYIGSMERFLDSEGIVGFKPESFADVIAVLAEKKKRVRLTSFDLRTIKLIKMRIRIGNSIQVFGVAGMLKRLIQRAAGK